MTKKLRRSLFEYLGIADQERIHTQTLAWILDPKDSPLSQDQIIFLYKKLFNTDLEPISVSTEYKNIDLVINFDDYIIGVENKLKSRQSDQQLKTYKDTLDNINENNTLYFLTFSGEIGKTDHSKNLDYQCIHDVLYQVSVENNYVKDYLFLLKKMLEARKFFLGETKCCNEVFRRSGLKTELRATDRIDSENKHVQFICENRLERLFVEIYYRDVMRDVMAKLGRSSDNISVEVLESNGHALIQVHFNYLKLKMGNVDLVSGFQFQSGTIKYNISSDRYKDSRSSDIDIDFKDWLDQKFDKKNFKTNPAKSKAYRSYSFRTESLVSKNFEEVCNFFKNEIQNCENKWRVILDEWSLK